VQRIDLGSWNIIRPFLHFRQVARAHLASAFIQIRQFFYSRRLTALAGAVIQRSGSQMPHRRRRVFIDTPRGRVSAGFTVSETADAADVSLRLRERGWTPYGLRLEREQHAWIAVVIDWVRAA
jgi:hypothetical protein